MVLNLIDICMNNISKNLPQIKYLDTCLTTTQKQEIIKRLLNHNLYLSNNTSIQFVIENLFTQNLKELHFYKCDLVTDYFLRQLAKQCKFKLKSLKISRCVNISDDSLKDFILTQNSLEEIHLKRFSISLSHTIAYLKSPLLEVVNCTNSCLLNDKDLYHLCMNNPCIKSLTLTNCTAITNDGMKNAFVFLCNLECLYIEGVKGFDETLLIKFSEFKRLSYCGSDQFNSPTMTKFFESCSKLIELNIHYSLPIGNSTHTSNEMSLGSHINNSLLHIPCTLESLTLFRPNIREPQILIDALRRLKSLKKLSLHCVECINDVALTLILEVIGNNLIFLDLGGYMALPNKLTDTSVKSIAKYCKNLEHLCLDLFSSYATLDSLATIFTLSEFERKQKMEQSRRAQALKTFRVSACRRVSYDLLLQVAYNCSNLRLIDLSGLNELVDDSLIQILASNAPHLSTLDLKACTRLTDKSIVQIAIKCPITCLVLSGINNLTDKIIFVIANSLCQYLEEIYLSGCSKISRVAINYLTDCCIKRLVCEHKCPNVDPNQLWAKNLDTGCYERVA